MRFLFVLIIIAMVVSCSQPSNKSKAVSNKDIPGVMLADTISYPVVIKNSDSTDTWTEDCLRPLDRKKLIDQIFESIYLNNAQAYSYLDNKPLSISDIKELEQREDFSRDKVGKLQFWESWYFDEKNQTFTKKVHAILIAYEALSPEGDLRNYRAAFYIKTNN